MQVDEACEGRLAQNTLKNNVQPLIFSQSHSNLCLSLAKSFRLLVHRTQKELPIASEAMYTCMIDTGAYVVY